MMSLSPLSLALLLTASLASAQDAVYNVTVYNAAGETLDVAPVALAGSAVSPGSANAPLAATTTTTDRRQTSQVKYLSSTWCGFVQESPAAGVYDQAVAEWTLPSVVPDSVVAAVGTSTGSDATDVVLAQFVGVDGFTQSATCSGGLFGGTAYSFAEDGSVAQIYAWWEFLPAGRNGVSLDASVGDTIKTYVTRIGTQSGTVIVENLSTGTTVIVDVDGSSTTGTLCGGSVEWITGDLNTLSTVSNGLYPNFTTYTFSDVYSETTYGSVQYLDGASLVIGGSFSNNGSFCFPTEVASQEVQFTFTNDPE